jgi:hypothetical protein
MPFFLFFVIVSLLANLLFIFDIYFPIWASVLVVLIVSFYLFFRFFKNNSGVLILIIWIIYALPFIHIPAYIWFDFKSDPLVLWGLRTNPYMIDKEVIKLTGMIISVGALGLASGVAYGTKKIIKDTGLDSSGNIRNVSTLNFFVWIVWVLIGVLLSALSAPKSTVFGAVYTASESALDGQNFSSAWMMSYVILTFTFCDSIIENNLFFKKLKTKIIIAAILIVVIYYQLLRGDRECLPWVFGILIVYYYWAGGYTRKNSLNIPLKTIIVGSIFLFIVSFLVAFFRSSLDGADFNDLLVIAKELYQSDVDVSNYFSGTWSAVLLTPLSIAGDHIYGLLPLKLGKDYLNLFLSLPPGFITDAIGYHRPIDAMSGPAWEMRYGMGGTHATVLPFMNFRMVGIFFILFILSFAIVKFELFAISKVNVSTLSLLTVLVMASPHWLWYGEKNLINAILLWGVLSFLYKLSISFTKNSV